MFRTYRTAFYLQKSIRDCITLFACLILILPLAFGQTCTPIQVNLDISIDANGDLNFTQPGTVDNSGGEECCDGTTNGNVDCVLINLVLPADIDTDCVFSSVSFMNDQGNIYVGFVDEADICSGILEYGNNAVVDQTNCGGGFNSVAICKPGNLTVTPILDAGFKCNVDLVAPADVEICDISEIPPVSPMTTEEFQALGGDFTFTSNSTECACDVQASELVEWQVIDDNNIIGCSGTYTRTYQANYCGFILSAVQNFTLALENAPTIITCPPSATVGCAEDAVADISTLEFSTFCMLDATASFSGPVITGGENCDGSIYTFTYTVEDDCGNMAFCEQDFTLSVDAVTIECPADETVDCFSGIVAGTPVVTTDCTLGSSFSTSGPNLISGDEFCDGSTYEIVYTATDDCGTMASCSQIFTLNVAGPSITCPADATVDCFSGIVAGVPSGSTDCTLGSTFSNGTPVLVSGLDGCDGAVYSIEHTITDDCGQTASCFQFFTILVADPTITCSTSETVTCVSDIAGSAPTFTTACNLTASISSVGPTLMSGTENCDGAVYEIEFTVTDDCGSTASCIQSFTLDVPGPTITCPPDENVSCFDDIAEGTPSFTTECGLGSTVSTVGPTLVSGTDLCAGATYEIVYTIEDECGSMASCTQTFVLTVGPPTITCPVDEVVACFDDIFVGTATTTTECGLGSTVSTAGPTLVSGSDLCAGAIYEIEYTVEDDCGVTASCVQTFTLDVGPPTITCPVDETVDCFEDIVAGTATTTTECGLASSVSSAGPTLVSGTDLCAGAIYEIEYTVEDDCGVTASCVQTFTLAVGPPTITCPADETVACFEDIVAGIATTTTECGLGASVSTTAPSLASGSDLCDGATYEITYTVTDDCGTTASCVQTFTLAVGPPTITCPIDETVDCFDDIVAGTATTTTECGLGSTVSTAGPILASGVDLCDGSTYEITYTVTDDCGSTAECIQTFTLNVEPPEINCPADETVSCFSDIVAGIPITSTGCSLGGTVTSSEPLLISGIENCDGAVYEITFNISDECGVSVDCAQTFTLEVAPPTIVCPPDETVSCFSEIIIGTATATTSCGFSNTISTVGPTLVSGADLCDGAIYEVEYIVVDDCNVEASCIQTFTLDVPPPTITCPSDQTVNCFSDIIEETVSFTVSCGFGSEVITNGPTLISGVAECDGAVYELEYTITDDCGVTVSCVQVWTLLLNPPVITCPQDMTVECLADVLAEIPEVNTDCGLSNTVSTVGPTLVAGQDGCDGAQYTFEYTVTDACGVSSSCVQTFTINNLAPVINSCPASATITCLSTISPTASDIDFTVSCGLDFTIEVFGPMLSGPEDCPGTTATYDYVLTDECGRSTSCSTIYTLDPPEISTSLNMVICSDSPPVGFLLEGSASSSAIANYNIYSVSADGILTASSGSTDLLANSTFPVNISNTGLENESYTNAGTDIVTITYSIAPVSPDGCEGKLMDVTIMILPESVLTNEMTETICSNDMLGTMFMGDAGSGALGMIQIASLNANGLTGTNIDPLNTDIPSNSLVDDVWENTTGSVVIVEYEIIPISDMNCFGDPFILMVTVLPEPVIAPMSFEFCSDETLTIDLQSLVENGMVDPNFDWIATDNINTLGESLVTTNSIDINDIITNDQFGQDEVVTYTITPYSTDGCVGVPIDIDVTILAEPKGVDAVFEVCHEGPLQINLQDYIDAGNGMTGVNFSYSFVDNPIVEGENTLGVNMITGPLSNTSTTLQEVVYTIIPESSVGCIGDPFNVSVLVSPIIELDFPQIGPFCVYDMPVTMTAQPEGGVYSGAGVVGNAFDPGLAGGGDHVITYDYVNEDGCPGVATISVYVSPPLSAFATIDGVCNGDVGFASANVNGGTAPFDFSWEDLGTGSASGYELLARTNETLQIHTNEELTALGTVDLEVTIVDAIGCITTSQLTAYINPKPTILAHPEDVEACPGEAVVFSVEVLEPNVEITWTLSILNGQSILLPFTGNSIVLEDIPVEYNGAKIRAIATLLNGNPGPDCPRVSEPACIYVHESMQLNCTDQINLSFDEFCTLGGIGVGTFLQGDFNLNFYTFNIIGPQDEIIDLENPSDVNHISNYVGECLKYEVIDLCYGFTCWGEVCIQDKIPPTLSCECETPYLEDGTTPNPDCTFSCFEILDLELLEDRLRQGNEVLPDPRNVLPDDNCLDFGTPEFYITYDQGANCSQVILNRELVWTYQGLDGEYYTLGCQQQFLLEELSLENIGETVNGTWDDYPNIFDANVGNRPLQDFYTPEEIVHLPCGADYSPADIAAFYDIDTPGRPSPASLNDHSETPNIVEYNEGYPYAYPYVVQAGWTGRFHARPIDNNICNIYTVYSDLIHESCAENCYGNSKIARSWTILDWCTASTFEFAQTIKRADEEGPQIDGPDQTVSVDPWACTATYKIPDPEHLLDNCDKDPIWSVIAPTGVEIVNGYAVDLPKGETTLTYLAEDCCGNQSSSSFTVTVVDNTPPAAIALQNLVVQLSNDQDGDGIAKLFATDVNNESHDGCGRVHLEIRRSGNEACNPSSNASFNNDGHLNDLETDTDNGEFVIFCCSDLNDEDEEGNLFGLHDVQLRVWDDGDMDGVFGSDGDNYNEIWTTVRVEDKQQPIVICPPHVELSCHQDFNDYDLTGRPHAFSTCGDIICDGEPSDSFRAKPINSAPFVGEAIPAYNPNCRRGAIQRRWNCQGQQCTQWIIMRDTEEGDLEITWPDDVTADCIDIEYDEPYVVDRLCELVGTNLESDTFYFEDGACYKILNHWTVINWCDYDANDSDLNDVEEDTDDGAIPGLYSHTQILKLIDTEKPTITTQDTCFAVNGDCVGEGIQIWAGGADNGICASPWLKWEVEVDMNTDWVIEYTFSSYFASNDPFYIAPTAGDVHINLPDGLPNGCASTHRVRWTVSDGCGNERQATSFFTIEDKKEPTPYMLNLSTALMQDGSVELWASDFDTGSFDNCTPEDFLLFTFSDNVPPQLLDEDEDSPWYDADGVASENDYLGGNAELWNGTAGTSAMIFNEQDLESSTDGLLEVPIYVWDLCGNSDFAIVNLNLVDNDGDATANIGGRVATEAGEGIENVTILASSDQSGYPEIVTTTDDGFYMFEFNPMYSDYKLTGEKNDDWLNGVTTLDILLIQRHILDLEKLDSPYKLIAADASNDQRISAVDLIQLRKLILGIYEELPNNDSWRFIDADSNMNSESPWPFSEFIDVNDLQENMEEDFIGTKIGDVNGSIDLFTQGQSVDGRSSGNLEMNIQEEEMRNGLSRLTFSSNNFNEISGFQFSLKAGVSEIVEVEKGQLPMEAYNISSTSGNLNVSWNSDKLISIGDQSLFSVLVYRDNSSLEIANEKLIAEAYQGSNLDIIGVNKTRLDSTNELFQNEPNPWVNQTTLKFSLAKQAEVNISFFDVNGKMIFSRQGQFEKGENEFIIGKAELNNSSGLLYYRIENEDFSLHGKMIQLK